MGIVIAAATAAAVAQVVGAWTSLPGKAAVAETSGPSTLAGANATSSPAHGAAGPTIAVILPTPPAAAPPAAEPAPSSPGSPPVGSSAPGSSPAPSERNRGQEPTAVKKSRPGRKAVASKTARRKAHAAKAGHASRSGPSPVAGIGAPAPTARRPAAVPVSLHPDDVMPIGDP